MKSNLLVVALVVLVASLFVGCGGKTEKVAEKKPAGTAVSAEVNDPAMEAVAQANTNTSGGESVSIKVEVLKGDKYAQAAVLRELGKVEGNASVTLTDGKTMSISRTANVASQPPVAPQITPPTQTIKVEVVASGSIPVTGNGSVGVKGSGNVAVTGNGSIPVTGSGKIDVKGSGAISAGTMTVEGKSFELYKDQCNGLYYKGTDGQLHPIK